MQLEVLDFLMLFLVRIAIPLVDLLTPWNVTSERDRVVCKGHVLFQRTGFDFSYPLANPKAQLQVESTPSTSCQRETLGLLVYEQGLKDLSSIQANLLGTSKEQSPFQS